MWLRGKIYRCRAKFMTCEIHDYRGSAHAHAMRRIALAHILQLDNNTCISGFGSGLGSEIENRFFYRHHVILPHDYCIKKNTPEIQIADIKPNNNLNVNVLEVGSNYRYSRE